MGGRLRRGSVGALGGVAERDAGLASATNTAAFQVGGAFGAAIVTTVAASRAVGPDRLDALAAGYRTGFATCAVFAVIGIVVSLVLLRRPGAEPARVSQSETAALEEAALEVQS